MGSRRSLPQTLGELGARVGALVRRERAAPAPPPPLTTQSSPGQIANLQEAHGGAMAPPSAQPPPEDG